MRKTLVVAVIATAALLTAACNTIEGMGKDVKAAGGAVERTARDTK